MELGSRSKIGDCGFLKSDQHRKGVFALLLTGAWIVG
jgi:hypothetical protein